jgi:RNA-dependent RNA polymerase
MGKFNHIKVVAKYAARLGQCFSTTRLFRGIPTPKVVRIPDIERHGYCFTDGVGKISPFLAQMVANDWEMDPGPSAFQFRMGGCKGVLVAWPDAFGLEVHIRKSQEKFHSEFNGLEIIRCSQFSVATLNRQTITILSSLGVPDDVFVNMLTEQLRNYDKAMTNPAAAVSLLRQYVDENQMTLSLAQMVLSGFMDASDPFTMTLLHLWRSWSIKALKERARIIIEEGAFVLGCVDETGTLKGYRQATRRQSLDKSPKYLPQIFIQVPDPKDRGTYKVITGLCAVGRNPSLHPGDIRVVEAVDVPDLRHLRDVVVFPIHGSRDIPSMCSGGDLDGDDFFVIWDQKLLPQVWFNIPMEFKAPPAKELDRDPTVQDLTTFFALYMKNNSLPVIAHAHLAQADFMDSGPKDARCELTVPHQHLRPHD